MVDYVSSDAPTSSKVRNRRRDPELPLRPRFQSTGRHTYDGVWPGRDGDYADRINGMTKYVDLPAGWLNCDVDASWWVTPTHTQTATTQRFTPALRHWLDTKFPFTKPDYSDIEIPKP